MTPGYAYDHAWTEERIRLAGLEVALDPGTHRHLTRLGVGPGTRCLEIGAGGGSVAFWLAEQVAPDGTVVATDLETDFLESEAAGHPGLEVLRHDIMTEELPTGFDLVHARWLVEWLPDKRLELQRMAAALRPGGVVLIEEPDFVTIYGAGEPLALRHAVIAADAESPAMARLRREHTRMLGNGYCTRPVELGCAFETICETCTYFATTTEFVPVLIRQRDHSRRHRQPERAALFGDLIDRAEQLPS